MDAGWRNALLGGEEEYGIVSRVGLMCVGVPALGEVAACVGVTGLPAPPDN